MRLTYFTTTRGYSTFSPVFVPYFLSQNYACKTKNPSNVAQLHQFCLVSPRDLLFVNTCCLPYPLTNSPISLHLDLLPLP